MGASEAESTPAGDAGLDLAQLDLVGEPHDRFKAGGAGLLEVVGGGVRGEGGPEHGFAGQVEVPGVLQHRAGGDFPMRLTLEPEPGDETVERGDEHVLVRGWA
jgi:hypothetical protein